MKIQDRLNLLKPWVVGMRFAKNYPVVDAMLKDTWEVKDHDLIKYGRRDDNKYYLFYSESDIVSFDDLLDYIEDIINYNIELEKKAELLKIKKVELANFFNTYTHEELCKIKFIIDDTEVKEFDEEHAYNEVLNHMVKTVEEEENTPTTQEVEDNEAGVRDNDVEENEEFDEKMKKIPYL